MKIDLDYNINNMETSVNNKCKAFTSLKQSKKLAEILPIKSADMYYDVDSYGVRTTPEVLITSIVRKKDIPCWSLAALLEELNRNCWKVSLKCCGAEWDMTYDDGERYISVSSDYAIDACVAMIEKLHKLNLL